MATKYAKRPELVAYTLQTGPVGCDECGCTVDVGERFYHVPATDSVVCSVICGGALRVRGNVRPFARAA